MSTKVTINIESDKELDSDMKEALSVAVRAAVMSVLGEDDDVETKHLRLVKQ